MTTTGRVECGARASFAELTCKRGRGHLGAHANVRTVRTYSIGQRLWGDNECVPALISELPTAGDK